MKTFFTIIITMLFTSVLWLAFIAFYPEHVPVAQFADEFRYEQIKKQKEMEIQAEMEIFLGKDGLKILDNLGRPNQIKGLFEKW